MTSFVSYQKIRKSIYSNINFLINVIYNPYQECLQFQFKKLRSYYIQEDIQIQMISLISL
ncbi:hypothetical protein pb186bvf_012960 [Paramecium bursaria]